MGEMADWANEQRYYTDEALIEVEDAGFDGEDQRYPVWTTIESEEIPVHLMETAHLFNAMKMCFNHLAEAHGGQPVWFQNRYSGAAVIARALPGELAWWVVTMLNALERRNDLPTRYQQPLAEIRAQVFGGPRRLAGVQLEGDHQCPF